MSDEKLNEITVVLRRIEGKIDASSAKFDQHVTDDAIVAADVRRLTRGQNGFVAGVLSVAIAIGAGIAYMARRVIGH